MQLYGDIFFFYNLIMDYLVLRITAVLWGKSPHRLLLWCTAANLCYLAAVRLAGLYPILPYVFLAAAVIFSLRPKSPAQLAGITLTAYTVTFLLGSLALGLMAVFDADGFVVMIPAVLLLFILNRISKSPRLNAASGLYPLELTAGGQSISLTALSDSGNDLKINGRHVIITDSRTIAPLLPYITDTFTHTCLTVTGEAALTCFYAQAEIGGRTIGKACIAISTAPINGEFDSLISPAILNETE